MVRHRKKNVPKSDQSDDVPSRNTTSTRSSTNSNINVTSTTSLTIVVFLTYHLKSAASPGGFGGGEGTVHLRLEYLLNLLRLWVLDRAVI